MTSRSLLALVLLAWLAACGGPTAVAPSDPDEDAPAPCVRFGAPPADQGLTPPESPVAPGDTPAPDCDPERFR